MERRRFRRVNAALPVSIARGSEPEIRAVTRDVSVCGLLLDLPLGPPVPSERVRFTLELGHAAVRGEGTVVRGTDQGGVAVDFDPVTVAGRAALWEFVQAL